MKLISVKVHTDIAMVVLDDYDINDPNLIEGIAEAVKQDLINIFDDKMITIQEIKTTQDVPPDYINTEPWLAPDMDLVECDDLTCKQLIESGLCNME